MANLLIVFLVAMASASHAQANGEKCTPLRDLGKVVSNLRDKSSAAAEGKGFYQMIGADVGLALGIGAGAGGGFSVEFINFGEKTHGYCASGSTGQAIVGAALGPVVSVHGGTGGLMTFGCDAKAYEGKFFDIVFGVSANAGVTLGFHIGCTDEFQTLFNKALVELGKKAAGGTMRQVRHVAKEPNPLSWLDIIPPGARTENLNKLKAEVEGVVSDVFKDSSTRDRTLIKEILGLMLDPSQVLKPSPEEKLKKIFGKWKNAASEEGSNGGPTLFTGCNSVTGDGGVGAGNAGVTAALKVGFSNYVPILEKPTSEEKKEVYKQLAEATVNAYPISRTVYNLCKDDFAILRACYEALRTSGAKPSVTGSSDEQTSAPAAADTSQSTNVVP